MTSGLDFGPENASGLTIGCFMRTMAFWFPQELECWRWAVVSVIFWPR
jgi:hypothetical protein